MLLGLARKKLGDVVFYRSEGQQRSRVRVREIRNPRTAKQSVQRMILATAAKMAAAYEPIVNHSWEGVAYGVASTRHFRSLAMRTLRGAAAIGIDSTSIDTVADFAIKGAPVVGAVDKLPIARGSLSMNPWSVSANGEIELDYTPNANAIQTYADFAAELAKLGLEPGDQITLIQQFINIDVPVAQYGQEKNFAQAVRFARITFATELPVDFEGANFIDGGKINPAFVKSSDGTISATAAEGKLKLIIPSTTLGSVQGAALVRSQRELNGKFKYSSADMAANWDAFDWNNADQVYPSYGDGVDEIIVGDKLYLQNAVATTA